MSVPMRTVQLTACFISRESNASHVLSLTACESSMVTGPSSGPYKATYRWVLPRPHQEMGRFIMSATVAAGTAQVLRAVLRGKDGRRC